jgi:glycine cleavage system H protein
MKDPEDCKYTKTHEWVKIKGGVAVMGVTNTAQTKLGGIVMVELPSPGQKVKQGDTFAALESVKAVSDVYAPVTGEVVEVNKDLESKPQLINEEPYGQGWIAKIKPEDEKETNSLMDKNAYSSTVGALTCEIHPSD